MITKGYVSKDNLASLRVVPVPKDLENWIEVDYDSSLSYIGKIYDIQSGTFVLDNSAALKVSIAKRVEAYKNESDGLFIEWQYEGTATAELIWRNKVAEIKARFPL